MAADGVTPALVFELAAATDGHLLFGDSGTTPSIDASAVIAGTFPPLTAAVRLERVRTLSVAGTFPPMTGTVSMRYSSNTQRPTVAATHVSLHRAESLSSGVGCGLQDGQSTSVGWVAHQQQATCLLHGVEHHLPGRLQADRHSTTAGMQDAAHLGLGHEVALQDAGRAVRLLLSTAIENAAHERAETAFRLQDGDRSKRSSRSALMQEARPLRVIHLSGVQRAAPFSLYWLALFQEGVPPPIGVSTPPMPPVQPGGCYTPSGALVFSFPAVIGGNLVFQCGDYTPGPQPGETIIVPVRRVYIVINDTSLRRVDGGIDLKASRISLSLDIDTWAWGLSATLPLSALPNLEQSAPGVPVEVEASINGTVIRALVESVSRQRTFTDASLSISGRGKTSLLAGGYAGILSLINDQDRTAQQLCGDLLLDNGVPMPWTVDWQLTDWLVPAGAFVHQGDRISGLVSIAEAAGGFLRPHNSLAAVSILPRYAAAPWNWASVTPDFVLPSDVTSRESMEWIERPTFNRVFVSGEDQGVLGQVTRTGSAGDLLAPMVTHPLITHADAARQRGIAELAKGGRIVKLGLRLPVLADTGVLLPGHMVQYDDAGTERIGRVNSVQVDVSGGADVWQAIELEAMA